LPGKIDAVNIDYVKADAARFIPNAAILDIWSPAYFHDLAKHLKVVGKD